jgi:hypothetical protein
MFQLLCVCHTDQVCSCLCKILFQKQIPLSEFFDYLKLYLGYGECLHSTNSKHKVKTSRPLNSDMIRIIHKVFPRSDDVGNIGQGWNIPKMHTLPKFVDYMILFGSAINCFGGVGECNHKTFVKDTGSNTQKRINSFTSQVATCFYELMILDAANKHKNNRISTNFEYVGLSRESTNRGPFVEGKYILTISDLRTDGVFSTFSTKKKLRYQQSLSNPFPYTRQNTTINPPMLLLDTQRVRCKFKEETKYSGQWHPMETRANRGMTGALLTGQKMMRKECILPKILDLLTWIQWALNTRQNTTINPPILLLATQCVRCKLKEETKYSGQWHPMETKANSGMTGALLTGQKMMRKERILPKILDLLTWIQWALNLTIWNQFM